MRIDLPNLLTLCRVAAIAPLLAFATAPAPAAHAAAALVFAPASATDWLDGALARRATGRPPGARAFGRMLDPIADKMLVAAALMALAGTGRLAGWPLYAASLILLREVLVSGLREHLASARTVLPVTRLAKWKTGAQMVALGLLLARDDGAASLGLAGLPADALGRALLAVATVLTLATGWGYAAAALRYLGADLDGPDGR